MGNKPSKQWVIEYGGETIRGDTGDVVVHLRRKYKLTTYEIGRMLDGMSHQGVAHHLTKYPELRGRSYSKKPKIKLSRKLWRTTKDLNIMKQYHLSKSQVGSARREAGIKSPLSDLQLQRRKDRFCIMVFGDTYLAAINFNKFLENLCAEMIVKKKLTQLEAQLLVNFYCYEKKDDASSRARRTLVRNRKITPYVNRLSTEFVKKLIAGKVLQNNVT